MLRYRRQLEAPQLKIFADMLVKHAAPLAPLTAEQAALDTWKRGGADALIVSGSGTGAPVSATLLDSVHPRSAQRFDIYRVRAHAENSQSSPPPQVRS